MKLVTSVSIDELRQMAEKMYGNLVKADVDISRKLLLIDMDMHADGETYLLENGSSQSDLWGVNLHPDKFGTAEFIEFDSMINIRPRQNNFSRSVQDVQTREQIKQIVAGVVHE